MTIKPNFSRIIHLTEIIYAQPQTIFLILSLIFGGLFIFGIAPLNGTDEFTHFPRVYQISQGVFWEHKLPYNQYGGYLPTNINRMINDYRDLSRKPTGYIYNTRKQQLNNRYSHTSSPGHKLVPAIFTSVVIYPPWAYIPSLVGLMTAQSLHLPLIYYVYLSRISSILFWIILVYITILLLPSGKWFMVIVALLPTSLTQAATIGADGLLTSISWLMFAYVIYLLNKKKVLNYWHLISLTLGSLLLCLIKDSYWLLSSIIFVFPNCYFGHKLYGWIWRISSAAILIFSSLWFALRTAKVVAPIVLTPIQGVYINSSQQINYILNNPFLFLFRIIIQPFTKSFDTVYLGIVGIITNRLIYLSIFTILILFLALIMSLQQCQFLEHLSVYKHRLLILTVLIVIGTYILISTAFYIGNTGVGASQVNGIYGRYYLPILPYLLVPFYLYHHKYKQKPVLSLLLISIIVFSLTDTIMSLN